MLPALSVHIRLFTFAILLWATPVHARVLDSRLLDRSLWKQEQLAPGVRLFQQHSTNLFGGPQFISLVSVELKGPSSSIGFAAAQQFGKLEMIVPELGERSGALLAINGGFFDETTNANCGILKIDGKLLPFSTVQKEELWFVGSSAIGFDRRGQWQFLVHTNQVWPSDWKEVHNALAGGHHLIIRGIINPHVEAESYDPRREQKHAGGLNPRTAFGITTNHQALLITIDGRHKGNAEGITLKQLAHLLADLGCTNAINLDGGGSTTMWLKGRGIINYPSDNKKFDHEGARLVRTAVIIKSQATQRIKH